MVRDVRGVDSDGGKIDCCLESGAERVGLGGCRDEEGGAGLTWGNKERVAEALTWWPCCCCSPMF